MQSWQVPLAPKANAQTLNRKPKPLNPKPLTPKPEGSPNTLCTRILQCRGVFDNLRICRPSPKQQALILQRFMFPGFRDNGASCSWRISELT